MQRPHAMSTSQDRPAPWLVAAVLAAAALIFVGDVVASPRIAAAVPYVLVMLLALNARQAWFVVAVACACTCLTVVGFLASVDVRSPQIGRVELREAIANRLLALLAIWIMAVVGFRRRRRDEVRDEQAARREMILHSALDAVVSIDEEGRVIAWNPQAEQTFGWSEEESLGKELAELVIPAPLRQVYHDGLKQFLATGSGPFLNRRLELSALRRGNEEFPVELSILPLRFAEGYQFCAFVRDITDRHRAEQMMALLAAVVESSDDSLVSLDLEGSVSSWNRGAAVMYGYSEAEMVGTSILRLIPPESRGDWQAILRRVAEGEAVRNQEAIWLSKDGRTIDISLTVSPIRNSTSEIVGISTIGHDIGESKRNEESLRIWAEELKETTRESVQRKREAEEASRAKSQFLANMSHELRTPLNAIIGYSEMLQEDAGALGQASMLADLDRIRLAGKHLLKLINDVLDLSKVEFGKMDVFIEPFDIAPFVEEVASTVKPLVEQNGNALSIDCDSEIGQMRSDRTKVRQCLFNLLSNAAKFTNNGQIALKVSRLAEGRQSWLRFEVRDSGIGISKEQLEKVFDAFVQAETSTSRKYGGTGLGLTLTKGFCELLGGQLLVESEIGRGSTFILKMPAQTDDPERGSPALAAGEAGSGRDAQRTMEMDTDTVLIVDDDPAVGDMIGRFLEGEGFSVVSASTGEDGLALAIKHRPTAVILDVMLPGMDGWDVLSAMKREQALADIPVVMVSMMENREMGYALGVSGYLTKPIDRHRLLAILEKYRTAVPGTILVVDDDPAVARFVTDLVQETPWDVVAAESGCAGVRWLANSRPEVILLDLLLPDADGFAFIRELEDKEEWDGIPVIVLTAKDLTAEERRRMNGSVERIFTKGAFDRGDLLQSLRRYMRRIVPAGGSR